METHLAPNALKDEIAALQASVDLRDEYYRVSQRLTEWTKHTHAKGLGREKTTWDKAQQVKAALESLTTCYTDTPPDWERVRYAVETAERAIAMLEAHYQRDIDEERVKEQRRSDGSYRIYLIGDCVPSTLPRYTYT